MPTASMPIRLTTLGAIRVHRGETALPELPAQRLRFALLLYLAVERDVSRDEVVALFWPDRDTARGKHALRQMLYELRQVLGEDWIDMRRDRIVVRAAVDAAEFESAADAGRREGALRLYGGPFLLGFSLDNRSFEGWADRRAAHLARLHRRLERDYIAQLVAEGRRDDALAAARKWVELDPLDDEAAHTLIERLAAAGQRTAALQYYENYESQLAAELQVEPLDDTRALIASIRNGTVQQPAVPVSESVAPAGSDSAPSGGVGEATAADAGPSAAPVRPAAAPAAVSGSPKVASASAAVSGSPKVASNPAAVSGSPNVASASAPRRLSADGRSEVIPVRRGPIEIWRAASRVRRVAALAMLAVVLLTVGLVARPATQQSVTPARKVSIAVLPLNDNSMGSTLLPLANVLTEDLARGLALSPLLDVISPNGVRLMRAQGAPEDSLGRMLSADYLVGGGVTRYGERVRVDVELLDGRTGRVVRSEAFVRPWSESRNLVDDVVRGAASFLRREVGMHIEVELARAGAANEEAFRLVVAANAVQEPIVTLLEAREFAAALDLLASADSMLEIAVELDGAWAEPLVRRGWIRERRAFVTRLSDPGDVAARGRLYEDGLAMAAQAAVRDPDHAGAYALRGALLHQLSLLEEMPRESVFERLDAAERELRRATELDPVDQATWRRLADVLIATGRYGEAKVAAERAYRLDPYAAAARPLTNLLFTTSFEMGRDEDAHGWCSQGATYFPEDLVFVYCMLALHAWADGIEPRPDLVRSELLRFQQGDRRIQPWLEPRFETMIAAAYARAGQPDSARAILARVGDQPRDSGILWMRASVHALLGEDSAALALLEEWMESGTWAATRVSQSRPFWHLRERTELQRLIDSRIGALAR
jgi:DNA-binding SARP family transcriptional activator/TolB-like protein